MDINHTITFYFVEATYKQDVTLAQIKYNVINDNVLSIL